MIDSQLSLSSQQMEAILVRHADQSQHLQLAETPLSQTTPLSIGRQAGAHLLIDEASVSRRHAVISYINKQYMIQELGSTNGTFVNNQRIELARPHILQAHDLLRIGNTVSFRFLLRSGNLQVKRSSLGQLDQMSATQKQKIPTRPVLNHDGTLTSPGIDQPVPASVVATLKEVPALIILPPSSGEATSLPPWVYLLKPNRLITLGRERGNIIELNDPVASRRHAELFLTLSGCYIRDLGSSNGIIINQIRIMHPSRLFHGDRIQIGETLLFFIDLQAGHEQTEKNPTPALSVNHREQKIYSIENTAIRTPLATQSGYSSYATAIDQQRQSLSQANQYLAVRNDTGANNSLTRKIVAVKVDEAKTEVALCVRCGVANTQVARFCASCSAVLNMH